MSGSFSSLGLSASGGPPLEQTSPLDETPESVEQAVAPLCCTFCGLGQGEAARLFQGRAGYICDECVDVCTALIADYQELRLLRPRIGVHGGNDGLAERSHSSAVSHRITPITLRVRDFLHRLRFRYAICASASALF